LIESNKPLDLLDPSAYSEKNYAEWLNFNCFAGLKINEMQLFCRMGGENGEPLSWSAPSYFDLMVPGGGAEFSKVELCFVVPDDTTLNLFTKGSIGMELPKSRGEQPQHAGWIQS